MSTRYKYLNLKEPNLELIDDNFCKSKIKTFLEQPFLKNIEKGYCSLK